MGLGYSKRPEPSQLRYIPRDWEQGGLINEEETAYENSEGSNVANFTTEPAQSIYVPEPKRNKRKDETSHEELRQPPAKKSQEFKEEFKDQELKEEFKDQELKEEFKDQELKELEQEQQLLEKWLEEKTKEVSIIRSLYDQKTEMLDRKKCKLQVVNVAAAGPEPAIQSSPGEEEQQREIQNKEQQRKKDSDIPQSAAKRLLTELEQELKKQEQTVWELEEEIAQNRQRRGEVQSSLKIIEEEHENLKSRHQKRTDEYNQKISELQYAQEQLGGQSIVKEVQLIGHQIAGRVQINHETIQKQYETFFTGQAFDLKQRLKSGSIGSLQAKVMLSQIFQVIYDNVHYMLVKHLLKSPALVGKVQTGQTALHIKDRVREAKATDNLQRILPAIKTQKEMAGAGDTQIMKKVIEPLFRVSYIASSGESDSKEMNEIQMAFGILLESCGLMELTMDEIERKSIDTKHKLQFSAVEGFEAAKSLAGELLDEYIIAGIRLAWKMVTQIPPMIAVTPTKHEPHCTISDPSYDMENDASPQYMPLRPILYFSYHGQVALKGIVTGRLAGTVV